MKQDFLHQDDSPSLKVGIVLLVVLVTALVSAGSVYAWLKYSAGMKERGLTVQIDKLQEEVRQLSQRSRELDKEVVRWRSQAQSLERAQLEAEKSKQSVNGQDKDKQNINEGKKQASSYSSSLLGDKDGLRDESYWLVYSDQDISFLYPRTFCHTPWQEEWDRHSCDKEWRVERTESAYSSSEYAGGKKSPVGNFIHILPSYSSFGFEFGGDFIIEFISQEEFEQKIDDKNLEQVTTARGYNAYCRRSDEGIFIQCYLGSRSKYILVDNMRYNNYPSYFSLLIDSLELKESKTATNIPNWKVYRDTKLGFEFEYPPYYLSVGDGAGNSVLGGADNPVPGIFVGPLVLISLDNEELLQKGIEYINLYYNHNKCQLSDRGEFLLDDFKVKHVHCKGGEGGRASYALLTSPKVNIFIDGYSLGFESGSSVRATYPFFDEDDFNTMLTTFRLVDY